MKMSKEQKDLITWYRYYVLLDDETALKKALQKVYPEEWETKLREYEE